MQTEVQRFYQQLLLNPPPYGLYELEGATITSANTVPAPQAPPEPRSSTSSTTTTPITTPFPPLPPFQSPQSFHRPPGIIEASPEHAVEVMTNTFIDDPYVNYMLLESTQLPEPEALSYVSRKSFFRRYVHACLDEGAFLWTIEGAPLVVMRQIKTVGAPPPVYSLLPSGHIELSRASSSALAATYPAGTRYIHALAAAHDRDGYNPNNHTYSDIQRPLLREAARCGLPVYGETTNPVSCEILVRMGARVLGELFVGKGKVGRDGRWAEGGEGVRFAAVCFENPGRNQAVVVERRPEVGEVMIGVSTDDVVGGNPVELG